jgi:hypothetical protein
MKKKEQVRLRKNGVSRLTIAVALFSFLLVVLAVPSTARAQSSPDTAASGKPNSPDPADQGWHVDIDPYLWFAGIDGTVGALGHESSVHVSASDVLSDFNAGLMVAVETRYNRIVMPVDFMWVRLKDSKGIPITDDVASVHVKINEDLFTPKIGYRLVSKERFKMDALVGIRYWHLGTTLTLQPQIANGYYGAANWVDAVQGMRFQGLLTRNVLLTVGGDAGAGGSRLDYQVVGLLGYKIKRVTIQGGWRYLVIHKAPGENAFVDMAMTGVIVGVVIPVK